MTNEEKFKTPEEREKAFHEFCCKRSDCSMCEARYEATTKHFGRDHCVLRWLALEDEEERLLPCPFCGHPYPYLYNDGKRWLVDCGPCGCEISGATRDSTIVAWNRRVK